MTGRIMSVSSVQIGVNVEFCRQLDALDSALVVNAEHFCAL